MADRQRLLALALKGLEAERAQIDKEIAELKSQLGYRRGPGDSSSLEGRTPTGRKRRRMSAEGKRKISEAMKRRYAELKKAAKRG